MRAFFDTNLFISFLLVPTADTTPAIIVRAGLAGAFVLLVSQSVITELRAKVAAKRYLAARISSDDVETFAVLLAEAAEVVPELPEPYPAVGRDRKDDYLFAHAVLGQADYLVSGDNHLLAVGRVDGVRIASPAQFLLVLQESGRL